MAVTSINTNTGAMIALQSLEMTQQQLAVTQKQISTGYRVSDSTDDGAAYAIAQSVRASVGALTSANQQLGNVQGLLSTTQTALNSASTAMISMRALLVKLGDSNVQASDRSNYISQYQNWLNQLTLSLQDANYNGKSLINNSTAIAGIAYGGVNVARNETGSTYHVTSWSGSSIYGAVTFSNSLNSTNAAATGSTLTSLAHTFSALITLGGTFTTTANTVNTWLNQIGNSINFVQNQITYNNDKIDSLNTGLSALIDADMAKESAQLTALQIRQQLGTQALSLANQAPQSLLSLFK